MKRKLLFAIVALMCSVGMWAQNPGDDMTSYITNPTFTDNASGWTIDGQARYFNGKGFDGTTNFIELCKWDSSWDATISQTVTSLPNGYYLVQAAGQMSGIADSWMKLVANGAESYFSRNGDSGGNILANGTETTIGDGVAGWRYTRVIAKVTDGNLAISCVGHSDSKERWANFDAVSLTFLGSEFAPNTDVTEFISNWDFWGCFNDNFNGWSISKGGGNSWVHGNTAVEHWSDNLSLAFDYYQTVTGLPEGRYTLSASMWNTQGTPNGNSGVYATNSSSVTVFAGVTVDCGDNDLHTYTTDGIFVNDGELRVGVKSNGARSTNWFGVDWIKMTYVGKVVGDYAVELPAGGAMEADKWYYFDIAAAADDYMATATSLDNIICVADGDALITTTAGTVTLTATGNNLSAGRYYVKSTSANKLEVGVASYSYSVSSATADKAYIQPGQTVTVSYTVITNDPGASLSKDFSGVTFAGEAIAVAATDNGFSFTVPNVLSAGTALSLVIPAGAIGYAAGSTYNAAQEITLTTPAVFDGFYFLRAPDGRYVGRGSSYNTRAIIEAYGLPLNVTTNANGITNFKFADSNQYLFDAGNGTVYTDNTSNRNWAVEITEGGYYIINKNNNGSLDKKLGTDGGTWMQSNDNGLVWTIEPVSDHNAQMEALKDAQAATAAAAAGNSEITTKAALASWLDTDYAAVPIEVDAVSFTEKWNDKATAGSEYAGNGVDFYTKTVENLKPGLYKLTVNAYYRLNSQATTAGGARGNVYLYANDVKTQLFAVHDFPAATPWVSGNDQSDEFGYYPNNVAGGTAAMNAGNYLNELYVYVNADEESETGHIKYGIHQPSRFSNYQWCGFQNFTLTYYTNEVSADDVATLVASIPTAAMAKSDKDAIASAKEALEADATIVHFKALSSAIENAAPSIAQYETYNYYVQAVKANNEEAAASVETKYNEGTIESIEALIAEFRTNLFASLATDPLTDYTAVIVNPGFETGPFLTSGNVTGWEVATDGREAFASNSNNSRKFTPGYVGSGLFNTWTNVSVAENSYILKQNFGVLPAGMYRLTGYIASAENNVFTVNVGNGSADVTTSASNVGTLATVDFTSDGITASAFEIASSLWFKADDFHLTFVPNDVAYTLVEGEMNSDVAAAQTAAETAFTGTKTYTNYAALLEAIANAQASKDAYVKAAEALTKANTTLNSTNVYTAEAREAFSSAINTAQAAYDDRSMTDEVANGLENALNGGTQYKPENVPARNYVAGAWTATNGVSIYANNWSNEGNAEGSSGMTTPFIEDWVGDDLKLADTEISASLSNLENGHYIVTAFVRAMNKKTGEGETGYDGISLQVNDGSAVAFAEATEYSDGYAKVLTAEGLVKDGNLNIKFNVEGTNVSWLAIKNVNYTKDRDLNPEEMAVAPESIALYNGETVVTEPIALDKTNSTVTLNPVYTPAEASEGYINWTSSDESVATVSSLGEVTAVLPGTATITATSTLDNTVSASATVTVTYPESEVPASTYVNNGATRTVLTLGANLIENGSFEYPNAYYGWTYGTGSTTPITSAKFDIVKEGAANGDQYLKANTNEGGAAAGSLNTSWPIEPGKTYVFGYKIKSSAASTGNQYIGTSLNTTKGQENSSTKLANPAYGTDWTDVVYTFESGENTWLVFNARWLANNVSFDNFYLCEAEYTLEGNVDYATAAIPTANIGTGAFQYSQDAIDAANDLVQGTASVADVEAAYEALTTINEPADGQLFNVVLTYGGWTYDQKAMTYLAGDRSDMGGYNIKYQAAANENLAQAFTFTKVSGNNYKMSQIDADGNVRYICTVTGGGYGNNNTSGIRTTTDASKALVVTVIPTATDGVWNLRNTEANNYIGSQDAGVYTVNSHIDFNIVETHKPSISINTTAAGWGTVILPFVATLPDGVKAYSVETIGEEKADRLDLVEVNALEANKPYIIEGAWEETVTGDAQGINLTYTVGLLTGVYTQRAATAGTYVLQNNDNKVGFYRVESGEEPTVGANRAYLTVPAAAGDVKAFFFGDDTATAIQSVFSGVAAGEIYDLSGRKLNKLQKGVNIVNGKKVMVK